MGWEFYYLYSGNHTNNAHLLLWTLTYIFCALQQNATNWTLL